MKVLAEYKFKNNKRICVELINAKEIKKRGLNKPDNFVLAFETGKGKSFKRTALGLRADEMLQIITLLGYAVYTGVSAYQISLLKGYNGFNFSSPR